jgi:hypothetical protein
MTIQPGPWLMASSTTTDVPSVSWSLTVTDGVPPVFGTMGVGVVSELPWFREARKEPQAVKATKKGKTNHFKVEKTEFLFML